MDVFPRKVHSRGHSKICEEIIMLVEIRARRHINDLRTLQSDLPKCYATKLLPMWGEI